VRGRKHLAADARRDLLPLGLHPALRRGPRRLTGLVREAFREPLSVHGPFCAAGRLAYDAVANGGITTTLDGG
jgi:hypothetical protein